jgi:phage terminase large subunit
VNAPQSTLVRFEPRGAVLEAFRSREGELLISGAAGTGKSVGALMKIHLALLRTPRARALVARKTHASLTASTLVTFRQHVAAEALHAGIVKYYGGSGSEPAAYRYGNGSSIVVGGLDRPSRLLSTEYDLAMVDEATESDPEDIDTIVTRLRHGRLSYQQLIMCTNPAGPTHHLKARADAGRARMLYSRHEDNPRMFQDGAWTEYGATYLARLETLTGVRYQRMRHGLWVAAEGLVYPDWSPAVHMPVDRLPPGSERWTRWWVIDFGFSNPFVILCFAEDPDGRLWLYRQLYKTKTLVEDHAKRMLSIVAPKGEWIEPRPRAIIADHDAEDRATWERHFGMSTVPARKSVSDGIQAMQARLRPAGDGKPRFFVVKGSLIERDPELVEAKKPTCFEDEIAEYVWPTDVKPDKRENPVKENDHAMDCGRYMCAERDLGGRPRVRVLG